MLGSTPNTGNHHHHHHPGRWQQRRGVGEYKGAVKKAEGVGALGVGGGAAAVVCIAAGWAGRTHRNRIIVHVITAVYRQAGRAGIVITTTACGRGGQQINPVGWGKTPQVITVKSTRYPVNQNNVQSPQNQNTTPCQGSKGQGVAGGGESTNTSAGQNHQITVQITATTNVGITVQVNFWAWGSNNNARGWGGGKGRGGSGQGVRGRGRGGEAGKGAVVSRYAPTNVNQSTAAACPSTDQQLAEGEAGGEHYKAS